MNKVLCDSKISHGCGKCVKIDERDMRCSDRRCLFFIANFYHFHFHFSFFFSFLKFFFLQGVIYARSLNISNVYPQTIVFYLTGLEMVLMIALMAQMKVTNVTLMYRVFAPCEKNSTLKTHII